VRRLSPEEAALWQKVVASVRPLRPEAQPDEVAAPASGADPPPPKPSPKPRPAAARPVVARPQPQPGTTLDGTWDRRLSRGLVQPDVTLDLHGHNLDTAYRLLDARLEQAVAMGARLLLLITGKAPQGDRWPVKRGAIRAAVGDWLAASRHAGSIAAVRGAHQRHGGPGALYIVIRRKR